MTTTVAERVRGIYRTLVLHRTDLIARGFRARDIANAVAQGRVLRIRRDHYALPGTDPRIIEAVRVGGRLSCVSLLQAIGVFVLQCTQLHVHIAPGSSRLRKGNEATLLHWNAWTEDRSLVHVAPLVDAVAQAVRCQPPRAALATLDSVLHHGLMRVTEVHDLFESLPARHRALLPLIDGSAESGPETFMRLILRTLGASYETQVFISGVGRVDFVVDGWLIIECDSREFHSDWAQQLKDRRRDLIAASLGYVTVRPVASEIFTSAAELRELIGAIIATRKSR